MSLLGVLITLNNHNSRIRCCVLICVENLNYKLCIRVEIPALTYSSIDIIRTVSVTNTIQSTCQFISPSTTIDIMITSQSVTNNTDNNSATTAIIVSSVAGALLFVCIISVCIMVVMMKKCKTRQIRQGFFSAVTM